ncbi:MAG: hypothetical protein VBE63_24230 [Lamprobacter sp.]|uniref:hypothetical protein n=1 Tax=Lamprobacter sp. TaxID=3100796 RepID=UPI002B26210D|nr:hypothetical protein [Lamprobacter sp.]MEA3643023.1 hypothetical protein [Lamprobacter sp.]
MLDEWPHAGKRLQHANTIPRHRNHLGDVEINLDRRNGSINPGAQLASNIPEATAPPMLDKIDDRSVVPVITHREVDSMLVLVPGNDHLVIISITHDNRASGACSLIDPVPLARGIFGQIDLDLEAINLVSVTRPVVSRRFFRMRKRHPSALLPSALPCPVGLIKNGGNRRLLF